MNLFVLRTAPIAAVVGVPSLPPGPPQETAHTTLGWVLSAVGLVCLLGLVVIVVRRRLGSRKTNELRVAALLAGAGVLLLVVSAVQWQVHHDRQDDERRAWMFAEQATQDVARLTIERTYGITFDSHRPTLPLAERPQADEEAVVLRDGRRATCWFRVVDEHYDVRCGDDEDSATPLSPITP